MCRQDRIRVLVTVWLFGVVFLGSVKGDWTITTPAVGEKISRYANVSGGGAAPEEETAFVFRITQKIGTDWVTMQSTSGTSVGNAVNTWSGTCENPTNHFNKGKANAQIIGDGDLNLIEFIDEEEM